VEKEKISVENLPFMFSVENRRRFPHSPENTNPLQYLVFLPFSTSFFPMTTISKNFIFSF